MPLPLPLLLPLLLLLPPSAGQTRQVPGLGHNNSCTCVVNSTWWSFPVARFEAVAQQVETCEVSLGTVQRQVNLSSQRVPQLLALVQNITARLQPYQYLQHQGLYSSLALRQLVQELSQLRTNVGQIHSQMNNMKTQQISEEVEKLEKHVEKLKTTDTVNMKTVKEKLRYLKNTVESCRTIPRDFRGQDRHCLKGLITNISEPVTTKVSPHGKTYTSGSWGKQAQADSGGESDSYWVQPLLSSHIWGNTLRVYGNYEDFLASVRHKDFSVAPSYSHANAVEGPSAVLYGEALYYHCYRSADICRYDLKSNAVKRVTLPGSGVGFNNKFPYCYYDCRANSDVDLEADETGLWAIYATTGNHGNLVASRLVWDNDAEQLNVTQTWETRLFKKAASNAFMVCGVLYATRYVDTDREEVFYAFDTATGKEDNSLAIPLEKVAKEVASLSYNPTNKQLYMYNDGYLLAYQVYF